MDKLCGEGQACPISCDGSPWTGPQTSPMALMGLVILSPFSTSCSVHMASKEPFLRAMKTGSGKGTWAKIANQSPSLEFFIVDWTRQVLHFRVNMGTEVSFPPGLQ